jgi:hypothetical protein
MMQREEAREGNYSFASSLTEAIGSKPGRQSDAEVVQSLQERMPRGFLDPA